MAVDLSIPNSIIQAFMAGRQDKESTERTALEKERLKQQKEQEEARLKQQEDQFKATHDIAKKTAELNASMHGLAMMAQKQNIGKDISESGNIPPGIANLTAVPKIQMQGGGELPITPDEMKLYAPELGGAFNVPSHEKFLQDKLREAGQLSEATEAPKRITEQQRLNAQAVLQDIKDQNDYERAVAVANIGANARVKAGQASRDAILDRPINPQIQRDVFGLNSFDPTLTPRSAQGRNLVKPLDSTQQAGLKDVSLAEEGIIDLQNILKDIDYSIFTSGGLSEAVGAKAGDVRAELVGGRTGKVIGKSGKEYNLADIFTKLGDLKRSIATPDFGKVLPKSETDIIQTYIPESALNQTRESVKAKLDSLLKRMQANKGYILKLSQPSNQSNDIVTMPDGKKIKVTKRYSDGSFDGDEVK